MRMIVKSLALMAMLALNASAIAATPTPKVGDTVVLPTVRTLEGRAIDLSKVRDRTLVVSYFSSTCPFCAAEAPKLQKLARENPATISVVTVSIEHKEADQKARAQQWVKRFGITHPVTIDYAAIERALGKPKGLPVHFVFDRSGKLLRQDVGEIFEEDFDDIARMANAAK